MIASVLNDLENQNVIFNKPTTQDLDSYLIANYTDKKDPQNISQPENDNTQSHPESNLFSNQSEPDLEALTVDKAIFLEDKVQSIHFTVTSFAKENHRNFKNCETNNLRKHISKLEVQLSAIKSYVNGEASILTNKTESISNDFEKWINILQGKENSSIKVLKQNIAFLQNELSSKNEIINSLMEIQLFVLCAMPKKSSTSANSN